MTYDEAVAKKEKVLKLLEAHEDEYRLFYAKVSAVKFGVDPGVNTASPEYLLGEFRTEWEFLRLKADTIHTELNYLDEIIALRKDITVTAASYSA